MFQFRRFPSYAYFVQRRMTGYCPAGLPHSDIPGSMDICSSPRLFAACHVLLRLLMPRHSPCALSSLTCSSQSPLSSVSAFAKTPPAPLLLAFRRKLVFGERGTGVTVLLRVVREFLVLFENYAGFTKIEIVCHPASFRMLFHNQFVSSVSPQRNLSVALLAFVTLFSFQGADRRPQASACLRHSFQPLLQSDLKIRSFDQVFKSKGKSPGGPEWARTTDLTIISRTL